MYLSASPIKIEHYEVNVLFRSGPWGGQLKHSLNGLSKKLKTPLELKLDSTILNTKTDIIFYTNLSVKENMALISEQTGINFKLVEKEIPVKMITVALK